MLQEIATDVGISISLVYSILTEDMHLWEVWAKFVPKLVTEQQNKLWKEVFEDMLDFANHHEYAREGQANNKEYYLRFYIAFMMLYKVSG